MSEPKRPISDDEKRFRLMTLLNLVIQIILAFLLSLLLQRWVGSEEDRLIWILWPIAASVIIAIIEIAHGFLAKDAASTDLEDLRYIWAGSYAGVMAGTFVLAFLIGSIVTNQFNLWNLILFTLLVGGGTAAVTFGIDWLVITVLWGIFEGIERIKG